MAAALRDIEFDEHQPEECVSGVHLVARRSGFEIPHVPDIELVPRRLRAEDEADLRWRLAEPLVASAFGGSSMGAALERAESYGYGALPCRRCGGRWRRKVRRKRETLGVLAKDIETEEVVILGWRDGTGRQPRKSWGKRVTYATALARYRAAQCRKHNFVVISHHHPDPAVEELTIATFWDRGEQVVTPEQLRAMFPTLPDEETEPCQRCDGLGVVPRRSATSGEVTAWPKGSSVQLGGREGLDADGIAAAAAVGKVKDAGAFVALESLWRYQSVESLLCAVCEVAPIARVALEEYYAPIGDSFERRTGLAPRGARPGKPWDRLNDLTPAGNEPEQLRGPESLWRARVASQAAELYAFACGVFNLIAYGTGEA